MTNQNIVQSGEIDLTAPQGYLGVAENVKVPAGIVPPGGIVGHFGHTHNEPTQRLMAHNGKFGFFRFIRHFPCANAYGLEQKWKAYLRVKGRLIPVLRADGNVDYESFWVHNLQEWMQFEEEFQKMCDRLVDFICRTEEKRLELKIKEAEIAISANEASKAQAEAERERQKTIQMRLRMGLDDGISSLGNDSPELQQNAPSNGDSPAPDPNECRDDNTTERENQNDLYFSFIEQHCEKTESTEDRIIYANLLQRCEIWVKAHPIFKDNSGRKFKASAVRKAMESFMENTRYSAQRPPNNKKLPGKPGWNSVKFKSNDEV